MRMWKGKKYSVITLADGFEYKDQKYTSLSEIAMQRSQARVGMDGSSLGLKKKKEAVMKPSIKYCAIYTRKSSEEGLEQEFNYSGCTK
jgi:hypothetical protein